MDAIAKNTPTEIDIQTYLDERLVDQMNWYDQKSVTAQASYKRLRRIEIFSAATIPLLAGFVQIKILGLPFIQLVVGILGVIVAAVSGLTALNKYQDLWVEYRTIAESLKHHLLLFQTKTQPYGGSDEQRFMRLVTNVEGLISRENSDWSGYIRQMGEGKDQGKEPTAFAEPN